MKFLSLQQSKAEENYQLLLQQVFKDNPTSTQDPAGSSQTAAGHGS